MSQSFTDLVVLSDLNLTELKENLLQQNEDIVFQELRDVIRHLNFTLGLPRSESDNNTTSSTDNTKPIISLIGDSSLTLTVGTAYSDLGATANDNVDGNISSKIVINNPIDINTIGTYTITYDVNDSAGNTAFQVTRTVNIIAILDTTAPTTPTLTTTPSHTNVNSIEVILNGEANAAVYLNDINVGTLNSEGTLTPTLDTSGADGIQNFNINIKDSAGNISENLSIDIEKDTTPPATNSTINTLITDDTTPALNGNLPQGDNDTNTTNYTVIVEINDIEYDATNNEDGTWSIADDTIAKLAEGSIALANLKNHLDFNQDIETFHENSDIYNLMNDLAGHFGEHRGLIDSEDVKAHLIAVRDNKLSTKTFSETQTIRGEFNYEEGKKIKFSIYQLELGTTEGNSIVTPANLVFSTSFDHPKPRNIIRLLAVLDSSSAGANVVIDDAVREALEKYRSQIDINLPDGKANPEFNIPAGVDEFAAQFDDFEIGKDILDEITALRGAN